MVRVLSYFVSFFIEWRIEVLGIGYWVLGGLSLFGIGGKGKRLEGAFGVKGCKGL